MDDNKPKWTPGPWSAASSDCGPPLDIRNTTGALIASIYDSTTPITEDEPNVRLIAAAPELYEALEQAVRGCPCSLRERDSGHCIDCYAPSAIAALAKARGEQPNGR